MQSPAKPAPNPTSRRLLLIIPALIVITVTTFSPLFHAQFSDWDDNANLAGNSVMMQRNLAGLTYFWTHPYLDLYIPITYTVWWQLVMSQPQTDSRSLNPQPFHVTNVLSHVTAVLIAFAILRLIVQNDWAAACGALLFAVHPLQVESVGWVCGLKDVLAGALGFAALWCYLLHLRQGRRRWSIFFALGSIALILAMLAKPGAMIIPLIAAAIAIFALRRPLRDTLVGLLPWFCIAIATAIIARIVQPVNDSALLYPIWTRPLIAGDSLAFYLSKLFLPTHLVMDYGRTPFSVLNESPHAAFWTWIFPAALLVFLALNRRRWPMLFAAAVIFLVGLLPNLGFAAFSFQLYSTVADHYTYPAMLGPALALASVAASIRRAAVAAIFLLPIFAILCSLSFQQSVTWFDDQTIFTHVFKVNPHNSLAINHLWLDAMKRRDYIAAEHDARALIRESPNSLLSHFDLAEALVNQNRRDEAVDEYEAGIRIEPNNPLCYSDLAALYAEDGRFDLAIPLYEHALKLNPDFIDAQTGVARARKGAAAQMNATANPKSPPASK